MDTEIEIKLLVDAAHHQALCQLLDNHSQLASRSCRSLANSYFDTPEQQLRQWQMGLRVRSRDGRHEQTIKTAGREIGGLHQRPEYNLPVVEPWPQLHAFDVSIWPADTDLNALQAALAPLFTTTFERQLWQLEFDDGSAVEVAFDQGEIQANGQLEAICEVEFELLRGSADHLFELATALARSLPCRIGGQSKAARGYRLAAGQRLVCRELQPLRFGPEQNVEAAFEQLLAQALDQLQHHQEVLAVDGELDVVRQLRYGYQLLEQTLRVYAPAISSDATNSWQRLLAPVHASYDWVIEATFIENLSRDRGYLLRKLDDQPLLLAALAQRSQALPGLAAAQQALAAGEHTLLQLNLNCWLFEQAWRRYLVDRNGLLTKPVASVASSWLQRDWQPLLDLCRQQDLDAAAYLALWPQLVAALWTLFVAAGSCDEELLQEFISGWHDLQRGIFELAQLRYLGDMAASLPLTDPQHFHRWLERKQESLCHALEQSRQSAVRLEIPWLA